MGGQEGGYPMGIIARQSIRGTVVTYLGVFVGFITTFFVLTRFLTAEEIGLARVLIDAATLFMGLAQLGTSSSIIRFYPYFKNSTGKLSPSTGESEGANGFFFWTVVVPFVGFVIFALVWWVLHVPIERMFVEKSPLFVDYYYFVLPMAFFMLYQTIFETNANVLMNIVVPRAVREVVIRVLLLAVYLLYAFRYLSMDGFVIALCAVYGVAALCNLVYLISLGKISLRPDWKFLDRKLVRSYLLYTGFLILSAVASVLAPSLSSFFITAQLGLDFTGVFAIATYIAVMVSIPSRALNAISQPQLAEALKNNDTAQASTLLKQASNNLFFVGTFILLVIWVNIDLIFHVLPNGETYAVATNVVWILGVSQLLVATFGLSLSAINYSKHYYFSLIFSALLTISAIVLNNYLIPRWGMDGAAMANLLSYALYYACLLLTARLCVGVNILCKGHLQTFLVALAVVALNALCQTYLPAMNIWISAILRSVVLLGGAAVIAYCWNISPDINNIIKKYIR